MRKGTIKLLGAGLTAHVLKQHTVKLSETVEIGRSGDETALRATRDRLNALRIPFAERINYTTMISFFIIKQEDAARAAEGETPMKTMEERAAEAMQLTNEDLLDEFHDAVAETTRSDDAVGSASREETARRAAARAELIRRLTTMFVVVITDEGEGRKLVQLSSSRERAEKQAFALGGEETEILAVTVDADEATDIGGLL